MKILHISTADLAHGAGIAAYNLHLTLQKLGHDSKMLVSEKTSNNPNVYSLKTTPKNFKDKLVNRGKSFLENSLNRLGPQNIYSSVIADLSKNTLFKEAEVVHLHNLHWHSNNFSLFLIKNISKIKPVIWTFHDMWPITGHCIYSLDCDRWKIGCGQCPDLNMTIPLKLDTTAMLFKIKKHLYSRSNFTVVTPSEWLKQVASQSPLLTERNIRCINNGLNLELYQPVAKQQARQILGIESGFQVVLFASSHWSAAFKGYAYFERAILSLKETKPNLFLLGFGIGDFSEELKSKFPTLTLGYVNHEKIKSLSYSAADVFIFPTMAEAFGNVAIESMSCGTPVVGFKTGGLADSIVHLETGYLAEPGNVEDLARGILTLLNDDRLRENMAEKGRERAIDKFTLEIQAKNYLEAYKKEIEMFKSLN